MADLKADPCDEVEARVARTQERMREEGLAALLVFGDNKLYGSLRYLSGYFPDRAGWVSLGPREVYVFEGAMLVLPRSGEPVLLVDPGLTLSQVPCTRRVSVGSLASSGEEGLTTANVLDALGPLGADDRVGIEMWERFPAALYVDLVKALPGPAYEPCTIVEELRLVKSPVEVEIMRSAAHAGDRGHEAVLEALRSGIGHSELELARLAEFTLRSANPIYEDGCSNSPSMIATGTRFAGELLHSPQPDKVVRPGDIVHWDICSRHLGYSIDTSRTRILGEPTPEQERAYDASIAMFDEVVKAAVPGRPAGDLVKLAAEVASDHGAEMWGSFLGHGAGIDVHERPDMGVEATPLAANMTLAIEPRVQIGDYLIGHEDIVLVTPAGGESLNQFPKGPFQA
jgi:Xaa-Pro aminopeptidase